MVGILLIITPLVAIGVSSKFAKIKAFTPFKVSNQGRDISKQHYPICTVSINCRLQVEFSVSTGGRPIFNTLVQDETRSHSQLRTFASRNYKHHSIERCEIHFDILNRLGVEHECIGQTDCSRLCAMHQVPI